MKKITPVLSPEQKRTKEAYLKAYTPALLVSMGSFMFLVIVLEYVFSPIPRSGSSGSMAGASPVIGIVLAHFFAVRKLRATGLSLEAPNTEAIHRNGFLPVGQPIEWTYPKTLLGSVASVGGWFLMSAASWGLWHWDPISWLIKGLAMLSFVLFLFNGIVGIIFLRSPHVYIDENQIVGFQKQWWKRRVRWSDIARCDITHRHNYMGQGLIRTFTFKSATGALLLRLDSASLQGLTDDEQAEIEHEIRRRMGHEAETN